MDKDEWRLVRGKAVLEIWGNMVPLRSSHTLRLSAEPRGHQRRKEKVTEAGKDQIMPCPLSSSLCWQMLNEYQYLLRRPISLSAPM